ncbi:MAG: hypothetical protein ACYC1Z_08535 [Georgenia sp.]
MSPDPAGRGTDEPAGDPFHDRWVAVLTELELSVDDAEASLRANQPPPARPWAPPSGLGPMPAALRTRAELLVSRQTEVARQITEAASMGRRQARAMRSMRAMGPAVPVYVDTAG